MRRCRRLGRRSSRRASVTPRSPSCAMPLGDARGRAAPMLGWLGLGRTGKGGSRRAVAPSEATPWPPGPAARLSGAHAPGIAAGAPASGGGFAEAPPAELGHTASTPRPGPRREPDREPPGLADLDARLPPPGVDARSVGEPRAIRHRDPRLGADAAGGGMVRGPDGALRPHYWGHRERLRQRFLAGGARGDAGVRAARTRAVQRDPEGRREAARQAPAGGVRRPRRRGRRAPSGGSWRSRAPRRASTSSSAWSARWRTGWRGRECSTAA